MLNSVSEAGCDRMVHDSLGLRGWFSHSPIHRLSKHLLIPSMRVPRNCTERTQPCRMKLAEIRMTLSDHVCKAYMIHVPGRAGILSPVALFLPSHETSFETLWWARASCCEDDGTTWFFSSCGGILELRRDRKSVV